MGLKTRVMQLFGRQVDMAAQPRGDLASSVAPRSTDPDVFTYLGVLPNPDRVLRKLGMTEDVYEDILTDSHVASCVQSRKGCILSREWDVRPASSRRADRKAAELVKDVLNVLPMRDILHAMLDAPLWGRSYLEPIWELSDGMVLPARLELRPARRFVYTAEDELRVRTRARSIEGEPIPHRKILALRSHPSYDNPYGDAALSRCFWSWSFKKAGMQWWTVFAERYGMPWIVAKSPRGASPEEKAKLDAALAAAVMDAVLRISPDVEVDFKQAAGTTSSQVYGEFTAANNAELSKALLGQTLTTEAGDSGSYALGRVHGDVREDIAAGDEALVREAMGTLCRWITELNIPAAEAPGFYFFEEEEPRVAWVEFVKKANEAGIPVPLSYALSKTGIPAREGDEPMVAAAPPAPTGPAPAPGADFAERPLTDQAREGRSASDGLVDATMREARLVLQEWARVVRGWAAGAGSLVDADASLPSLFGELHAAGLADLMARAAVTARLNGAASVPAPEASFADNFSASFRFEPLAPAEAIRWAAERRVLTPDEFRKLSEEETALAFTVAGVAELDVLAALQADVQSALEQGTNLADWRIAADQTLMAAGLDPMGAWKAQTIFRNQIMTAYNVGRHEQMTRPAVLKARPIWQYDAIDDGASRPAHVAMDGRAFAADDPIWATWFPPNGHNCRCNVLTLSAREAARRGVKVETGAAFLAQGHEVDGQPVHVAPDAGWGTNPARARFVPDLRKWPARLLPGYVEAQLAGVAPGTTRVSERLREAGVRRQHVLDVVRGSTERSLDERWATTARREDDERKVAARLGVSGDTSAELLAAAVEEAVSSPDDIWVYRYKDGRVQYLLRKAAVGPKGRRLTQFGVIYDPLHDTLEGAHDLYTDDFIRNNRSFKGQEKLELEP